MSKDLAVVQPTFQEIQVMAEAVAKSGLFGAKTPAQALTLLLLAQAEGLHPMIAARDYDIIKDRPAKKSEALMRSFQNAGGKVDWIELTDTCAKATFTPPVGGPLTIDWTIERAKKAKLTEKEGSMYLKYPRSMLRARCVSEGIKAVWPAATSGLMIVEEAQDIEAEEAPKKIAKEDGKPSRLKEMMKQKESAEDAQIVEEVKPEEEPQKEQEREPVKETVKESKKETKKEEKIDKATNVGEMVEGVIEELRVPKDGGRGGCRLEDKWYGTSDMEMFKKMCECADNKLNIRILFTKRPGKENKVINDCLDILVLDKQKEDKSPI